MKTTWRVVMIAVVVAIGCIVIGIVLGSRNRRTEPVTFVRFATYNRAQWFAEFKWPDERYWWIDCVQVNHKALDGWTNAFRGVRSGNTYSPGTRSFLVIKTNEPLQFVFQVHKRSFMDAVNDVYQRVVHGKSQMRFSGGLYYVINEVGGEAIRAVP